MAEPYAPKPGVPPMSKPMSATERAGLKAALEGFQDLPATEENLGIVALIEWHLAERKSA